MTGHASGAALVPPEPARRTRVTSRDGVGLHVEIHGPAGGGGPTVVLIHGWTDAPADVEAASADIIGSCDRRARAAWGHVLAGLDVTEGVRRLDVPAHILVGSADRLTPPVHARRLARLLPQVAGLTELPRIGHMTPLEAPGVVAELIRKLAAECGAPA